MTKKSKAFTSIGLLLGFILLSYLMYYFFFFAMLDYGSGDKQAITSFALAKNYYPFYLLVFTSIFFLFNFYNLRFRNHKNDKSVKKHYIVSAILLMILSLGTVGVTVLKVVDKTFSLNFNKVGGLLLFYPYEAFVFSGIYFIFAIYYLVYGIASKHPFNYSIGKRNNFFVGLIKAIFYSLFVLIASYYFGIIIFSYKTFPRSSDHYAMVINTYLYSLIPFISLITYISVKLSSRKESYKIKEQSIASFTILLLTLFFFFLFYCYEISNPDFLVKELTNIFPLDHMLMKSYAFSIIIISATLLIGSLTSFIDSLVKRKRY